MAPSYGPKTKEVNDKERKYVFNVLELPSNSLGFGFQAVIGFG